MKGLIFSLSLLFGLHQAVWSAPIAHVLDLGQAHLLRGFGRELLSVSKSIEPNDVLVADRGTLTIQFGEVPWTFAEGSKLRLNQASGRRVVELIQGSLYVQHFAKDKVEIRTSVAHLKARKMECYLSLVSDGLELAHLEGEMEWKSLGHRMKWKKHPPSHRSRLEKGLSRPRFLQELKGVEGLVYQQLLSPPLLQTKGPLELDTGLPFLPTEDVLFKEQLRRETVLADKDKEGAFRDFQEDHRRTLELDQDKDRREVQKLEGAFSFPTPQAPPPLQ